jgi:hypothetical protein
MKTGEAELMESAPFATPVSRIEKSRRFLKTSNHGKPDTAWFAI